MTDTDRIDTGIAIANREQREIDHGTARAIASLFHDGSALTLSFASTGAIIEEGDELYRALFPDYASLPTQEQGWANWFGTYAVQRIVKGETGPIAGWANLWAPDR